MIEIDGSKGGGQVLRNSLAMSLATGKAFKIKKIRETRPKQGLSAQHVSCIKACGEIWDSHHTTAEIGTTELSFTPGKLKNRRAKIDIGTAGSITLLLQSILLPAILTGKEMNLKIIGGTDVKWAMPIDFFTHVLVPHLSRYAEINVKLLRRGYYPKGDGEIDLRIIPLESHIPLSIAGGEVAAVKGISHAHISLQGAKVAERQAAAAQTIISADIRTEYVHSLSVGTGITLWAVLSDRDDLEPTSVVGSDLLGAKDLTSEKVGERAAYSLKRRIRHRFDPNVCDNLIPFIGFLGGSIQNINKTDHIESGIYVVERFLEKRFSVGKDLEME